MPVKSITTTEAGKINHSKSMLINGHLIKGSDKNDCLNEFEQNRAKYEDGFRNSVEYFTVI